MVGLERRKACKAVGIGAIMLEVEIKLWVDNREELVNRLLSSGFMQKKVVCETDTYYTSEFHDMLKRDEALRIRTIEDLNTGEKSSVITYKGAKLDKVSMSRQEYETAIGDAEIGKRILEGIGFTAVPEVKKIRTEFVLDDFTACVDQVTGLGDFLEIEILTEDGMREKALERIRDMLEQLGFSMENTTRRSYLSMLMGLEEPD
jgi:adenylate cyclase class 2